VAALNADKAGPNTAHIDYVLSGLALAARFNSPLLDPRTPDLIIQPTPGTIYSSSRAKVMEHGGFAEDDTHVAMLVVNGTSLLSGSPAGGTVNQPVRTYQVAPTTCPCWAWTPTSSIRSALKACRSSQASRSDTSRTPQAEIFETVESF
jgi:hypothetical protein